MFSASCYFLLNFVSCGGLLGKRNRLNVNGARGASIARTSGNVGDNMIDLLGLLFLIASAIACVYVPRMMIVMAIIIISNGVGLYERYVLVGILVGLAVKDMLDEEKKCR